MIMKKQISKLFVAAGIVAMATSCIDDDMIDRVDFRNYYKTETDAQTAINGVYSTLYSFDYHKWSWVIAHPCFEDCMYATGGAANQLSMNAIGGNTSDLTNPWTALYGAINAANAVIRYVPEIEFKNENDRNRIIAEAHFLRGFYYYDLVRLYAGKSGIPLHTEPVEDMSNVYHQDTAAKHVYNLIIDDFKYAAGKNPDGSLRLPLYKNLQAEAGRVTNGAAYAYLADVHNTLGEWDLAVKYADTVIRSNQYKLIQNYADLWDINLEAAANDEKIFYVPFYQDKEAAQRTSLGTAVTFLYNPSGVNLDGTALSGNPQMKGQGFNRVQKWFIRFFHDDMENLGYSDGTKSNADADLIYKDYRIETTWWRNFKSRNNTTGVLGDKSAYPASGGAHDDWGYIRKYIDPNGVNNWTNGNDYVRMRFADMYLIQAEAYNELGEYEKACEAIDKIRERARHADGQERQWPKFLSQTREDNIGRTLSKDEFRWLVFMERGLEFAGENRRFFDLKRMRKDDNTMMYDYMMNTYIPNMAAKYPAFVNSTTVLAERKKWWPKPFTEVDRNPGVQQNPGY
ncbi:MAG: RagB/SusD family nutrient uptake outer membrane protein [Alistipes sp.]|nr:RagB/SusD family nutrient uptake outer membrane protein [Alistipes sp.]